MTKRTHRREEHRGIRAVTMIAVVSITAAALASAGQGSRRGHGERGPRGHGAHPGAVLRELDLSESQREQVRALGEAAGSNGVLERVMDARRAVNEAVESGADEGTIRQLAFQLGEAEGDAAVERARMQSEILRILTEEQRAEYHALLEERRARMEERRQRFQERRDSRRNRTPDSF